MWDRRARIIYVKDGDTLKVCLDQGYGDTKTIDLRLGETWAPEKAGDGGAASREFVLDWIARHDDFSDWPFVIWTTRLKNGTKEAMTFGRYVGVVKNADETSNLNQEIASFVAANGFSGGIGSK